jgi:hypothetical protein
MAKVVSVEYRVKFAGVIVYRGADKSLSHKEAAGYCNAFPEQGPTLLIEVREEVGSPCFCPSWKGCSGTHYRMGQWMPLGWNAQ